MRSPFQCILCLMQVIAMILLLPLALHAEVDPAMEGVEGRRAFDELGAYYSDRNSTPLYGNALKDLGSRELKQRQAAGRYLTALFAQSFADESNGRAEWKRLPSWGGAAESPARGFRTELAAAFAKDATGEAALDATLWLIQNETIEEVQNAAAAVLPRIDSPRMEKVLADLLGQPHPNSALAAKAIEESGRRKLTALAPRIRELCGHYRTAIREAARDAAPALGVKVVSEFKASEAFTPWLSGQLAAILEMVSVPAPHAAMWFRFDTVDPGSMTGGKPRVSGVEGWLLAEKKETLEVLTWFGTVRSIPKKETVKTAKKITTVAREIGDLYNVADARLRMRTLSERGDLTGQFESQDISTPAALVAAWCFKRGEREAAAALLFPRLNALSDDRWLGWIIRDQIGGRSHQEMLEDFCYARNYPAALLLAEHLSKPVFDGYNYQERAKRLALQLRGQADHFKTFKLPTPDEWKKQRVTLSRADQIQMLVAHLRLLNCIQMGQPGGVDYSDPQTAEAVDWHGGKQTPVINPFVELDEMHLTPAELPNLLPSLTDESFIPTFSYWRDFHPDRTLHQVNWLVSKLVNKAAWRDLVKLKDFQTLNEVARRKRIEEMNEWCKTNSGKSASDLIFESLRSVEDWPSFANAAAECIRQKLQGSIPVILQRLRSFPSYEQDIAGMLSTEDAPELLPVARRWLKSDTAAVRFYASLILFRIGDRSRNEGFAELKAALASDEGDLLYPRAIDPLVDRGDKASVSLAVGILKKSNFSPMFTGVGIINRLLRTGRPEVLENLVKRLDTKGGAQPEIVEWKGQQVTRTYTPGDEFAFGLGELRTDKWTYDMFAPDADRARKRDEMKDWLRNQVELIRAGKPTSLKALTPLSFPHRRLDTP